jgi:ectoine hydroxylase-related dioxygenase (phytanoyl-CoA dioxygenase family)
MDPMLSKIDLSDEPIVELTQDSPMLRKGAFLFLKYGFLSIKNAYDAVFVRKMYDFYMQEYKEYFEDKEYSEALSVGNKRTMLSLHLNGPFNDPTYYANPRILPLLQLLLGPDLIMNSLGSVISLPGATDQHIHRDHPNIYAVPRQFHTDLSWIEKAPPYAVTVGIPLIELSEKTGNTRFWPETHLNPVPAEELKPETGVDFNAEIGTAVLFDYRVAHGGVANTSYQIRPLLYNVYSPPWFRDSINYRKQDPLFLTKEQIRAMPKDYRRLFD